MKSYFSKLSAFYINSTKLVFLNKGMCARGMPNINFCENRCLGVAVLNLNF